MPIGSSIANAISRAASYAASQVDARDLVLALGLGLLSAGIYQISVPAAFIVPGAVLTYVAVWGGPKPSSTSGADD